MLRKDKMDSKVLPVGKDLIAQRWMWFRYALDDDVSCILKNDIHELINMYLTRHDEELETLRNQRSTTKRPKSSREHLLEATLTSDKDEYRSGFELPDITNGKVVKLLRAWDGDTNSMTRIKTIKVAMPIEKKKDDNDNNMKDVVDDKDKKLDVDAMDTK
ncbi:unnamed protein product [Cunninghamella blakesleeana]